MKLAQIVLQMDFSHIFIEVNWLQSHDRRNKSFFLFLSELRTEKMSLFKDKLRKVNIDEEGSQEGVFNDVLVPGKLLYF